MKQNIYNSTIERQIADLKLGKGFEQHIFPVRRLLNGQIHEKDVHENSLWSSG